MKKNPRDKESGLNKSYVAGLSSSTAKARRAHWDRTSRMDPKNPAAYEPAPGDKTAKTKESKYTKAYRKKFGEEVGMEDIDESSATGLANKAKESGVSLSTLRKVYKRGVAAWRTGHRPGTTPQQWGMARVNSYITKGKTYHTADKDLREKEEIMTFSQFVEALELHELIEDDFTPSGDELYEDWGEIDEETTHRGRKVKLGKPFLTPSGPKKRAVYVKNDKGSVVKVNFGDPNMTIKKHDPARRKSFRARHGCDVNPGPRWKARYWSCRAW